MAIKDDRLQSFFSKQKIGKYDSLKNKPNNLDNKSIKTKSNSDNTNENYQDKKQALRNNTKGIQKGNKKNTIKDTKSIQKDNKTDTIKDTKSIQKDNKTDTIKDTKSIQKDNKTDTIKNTIKDTKLNNKIKTTNIQNDDPKEINELLFGLLGTQKNILFYIGQVCCDKGTLVTPPISISQLAVELDEKKTSTKQSVNRLIKKGLLSREPGKKGKGGFSYFRISEKVKNFILNSKDKIIGFKKDTEMVTKKVTNDYVVSSSNINTNTTLPEKWVDLDIECLKEHGLQENHIIQIDRAYKKNPDISLSLKAVQDSIYAMAYDLKCNADRLKIKISPIAMLTSVLKRGEPYSSVTPENYMTPRELAMQKYQEFQKLREAKLKQMEQEVLKLEFDDWLNNLGKTEKDKILITANTNKALGDRANRRIENAHLKTHFEENIWPEIKQSVMSGNKETVI